MSVNGYGVDGRLLLNWALGALVAICIYFLQDTRDEVHEYSNKVHAIEILVAANYPTKDDLSRSMAGIHARLDRFERKIDEWPASMSSSQGKGR
jgi:low affinity Fe/Cu permease